MRLRQLPGSGVGQMRKGGTKSVQSRSRSRMSPAVSAQAKTGSVMARRANQIPFAEMRQAVDGFAARSPIDRNSCEDRASDLLIVSADLWLLGEFSVDLGEDRPHVRFR